MTKIINKQKTTKKNINWQVITPQQKQEISSHIFNCMWSPISDEKFTTRITLNVLCTLYKYFVSATLWIQDKEIWSHFKKCSSAPQNDCLSTFIQCDKYPSLKLCIVLSVNRTWGSGNVLRVHSFRLVWWASKGYQFLAWLTPEEVAKNFDECPEF